MIATIAAQVAPKEWRWHQPIRLPCHNQTAGLISVRMPHCAFSTPFRGIRRYTYRFFAVALAVLPRTTFLASLGFDARVGSAERAAAALVRRMPG